MKGRNNLCFQGEILDRGEDGVGKTGKDVKRLDSDVEAGNGGASAIFCTKAGSPCPSSATNLLGAPLFGSGDHGRSAFFLGLRRCYSA